MTVAKAQVNLRANEDFDKNYSVYPTHGTAKKSVPCKRMSELHGAWSTDSHLVKYCHKQRHETNDYSEKLDVITYQESTI